MSNRLNYSVRFAIDKKSARSYDADGRLHVASTHLSKANICPYLGREIPDSDKLGLDPDKIYKLLRHPAELAKAAPTFNGLPLLRKHVPVSADDTQPYDTIGATGTRATFAHPYLDNDIVVWPGPDIKGIESEKKKELSSAYRYKADMTPGEYEGEPYDGVMRDIVGNHVAVVEEGRAGSDVAVGDSMPDFGRKGTRVMSKIVLTRKAAVTMGALSAYLAPRLAADAKINFGKLLGSVNSANFSKKKGAIVAGIKEQTRGKLAKDASLEGVIQLLDSLEAAEDDELLTEPNNGMPMGGKEEETMDADAHAGLRSVLEAAGVGADVIEKACAAVGGGGDAELEDPLPKKGPLGSKGASEEGEDEEMDEEKEKAGKFAKAKDKKAKDEPPPFKGKPEVGGTMSGDALDKKIKEAVSAAVKQANDEADKKIKAASVAATDNAKAIRDAERFVRPWVGDLAMACDSAEEVYKTACIAAGVEVDGVHPSAFRSILERIPQPGRTQERDTGSSGFAHDSADDAGAKSFAARFPNAVPAAFA